MLKNAKIWFRISEVDKANLAQRCRAIAHRERIKVSARGGRQGQKNPGYLQVFMWLLDDYWERKGL